MSNASRMRGALVLTVAFAVSFQAAATSTDATTATNPTNPTRANKNVASVPENHAPVASTGVHTATLDSQCQQLLRLLKLNDKVFCASGVSGATEVARSHGARPIFAMRRGAALNDASATRVLILGGVHGDELTSGWLALKWASFQPPTHEKRKYAVLHVPLANPDGIFGAKPTRTNARGVDLNRNFPTPKWNPEANRWWVEKTKRDPRRFPGHSAASEIETKYIMRTIETFKPTVIVSIHAPLGVLDYDGGGLPPKRIGSIFLDSLGIYPGSLGHYGSRTRGVPVLTVELPHALNTVSDQESRRMWTDLFAWIDKYSDFDTQSK